MSANERDILELHKYHVQNDSASECNIGALNQPRLSSILATLLFRKAWESKMFSNETMIVKIPKRTILFNEVT